MAQTFFDGFAPLDALFGPSVRPGSDENLIDVTHTVPLPLRDQLRAADEFMARMNDLEQQIALEMAESERARQEAELDLERIERRLGALTQEVQRKREALVERHGRA